MRCAAFGAGLLAGAASAEELLRAAPLSMAFPQGAQGCFARGFDEAHLAAHPAQSVAAIRLARLEAEQAREDADGPEAPSVALTLKLALRGGATAAEPMGCEAIYVDPAAEGPTPYPAYLRCRSACNRGVVDLRADGADRVRLTIGGRVSGRFVADAIGVGQDCASDRGVAWLGDAEGDRVFLLERAPPEACR